MRYAVITRHRRELPLRLMCRVLEVAPSGYYAWRERSPSLHATADEILTARMRCVYAVHRRRYGAPRIFRELQAEGMTTSQKRVARLMARGPGGARAQAATDRDDRCSTRNPLPRISSGGNLM
jgi:hypothetical protein